MKPGSFDMEGDSFQEFSSPAIPFSDAGLGLPTGGCQPEQFDALEACTTVVAGPHTDVNSLDYVRCKTSTLLAIVERTGELILPQNLSILQRLASDRRQSSDDEAAERLLELVLNLQAGRPRT
jgi:hypothetical protein